MTFTLVAFLLISFKSEVQMKTGLNVYKKPLQNCCTDPMTGFYRNGLCLTGADDHGTHIVCAQVTDEFLQFSKARGNDLITPIPEYHFPGLSSGDKWCLCISRWIEAVNAGVAPPIDLNATHEKALEYLPLEILEAHDIKRSN